MYMYLHYWSGEDGEESTRWKSSVCLIRNAKSPNIRLCEFQETVHQVFSVQTCKNHTDKSKTLLNLYLSSVIKRQKEQTKKWYSGISGNTYILLQSLYNVFSGSAAFSLFLIYSGFRSVERFIIRSLVILFPTQIQLAICYRQHTQWLSNFDNYQREKKVVGSELWTYKKLLKYRQLLIMKH